MENPDGLRAMRYSVRAFLDAGTDAGTMTNDARAEEALAASERNPRLTIDTIPALVWSPRPDGSAEFFNQHYVDFTGLSGEQASGWGWTRAVHPHDLDRVAAWWQQILTLGAPGEIEARLRRHDGTSRWFL